MLFSILIAVMVIIGIVLIVLILLQQGKGADAGAAFGSGSSGTVFGARGSATFLSRTTGVLMALFMILAVVLAWLGQHGAAKPSSLMAQQPPAAAASAPRANLVTVPRGPLTAHKGIPAAASAPPAIKNAASTQAPVPKTGGGKG